jgi:hypothetical protein
MKINLFIHNAFKFLAVATGLIAMTVPTQGWALGSTPVTVVNPASSPIPVTGTVGVTGQVTVSGDVAITNTPSVTVMNQLNPGEIAKALGVQTPFQKQVLINFPPAGRIESALLDVPSKQRYVIESVTAKCTSHNGQLLEYIGVVTTVGSDNVEHFIASSAQQVFDTSDNLLYTTINQPTRIYADPATQIIIEAAFNGISGLATHTSCTVTISGQAIN